jgi:hypothetical protein
MFCDKCGKQLEGPAQFCRQCGAGVGESVTAGAANPADAAPRRRATVAGWVIALIGVATMFAPSRIVQIQASSLLAFVLLWLGLSLALSGSSAIIRMTTTFGVLSRRHRS